MPARQDFGDGRLDDFFPAKRAIASATSAARTSPSGTIRAIVLRCRVMRIARAALHFVQQLRPFGLGLGGLIFQNVRHRSDQSV
jgi:hypothetical protein